LKSSLSKNAKVGSSQSFFAKIKSSSSSAPSIIQAKQLEDEQARAIELRREIGLLRDPSFRSLEINQLSDISENDPAFILIWWKHKGPFLPLLAPWAKYVFCIAATSAAVERMWSRAKFFMTPLRNRTDCSLLQKELFAYINGDYYPEAWDS
jgi:hypothetical protein